MTTASKANASPVTFPVGGKEYTISPLTEGDHAEIDTYIQELMISRAIKMAEKMTGEDRQNFLNHAYDKAVLTTMATGGLMLLPTIAGFAVVINICIRKHHPEMTREALKILFADPANLNAFREKFEFLNGDGKPWMPPVNKKKLARMNQRMRKRRKR
jgi:hypothetical protein